jgi:hypothetical protein
VPGHNRDTLLLALRDMKLRSFLTIAIAFSMAVIGMIAAAAPLTTVRNSTLSVPAADLVAAGLPGATNLTGSNFLLGAVQPDSSHGGLAQIRNSQQWVRSYNFPSVFPGSDVYAIAVRPDGGVVVSGPSAGSNGADDFATICYARDGTALWTNRFDGANHGWDFGRFLAVDLQGNVWVTGESMRYATNYTLTDAVTIKYSSDGVPLWTNRYHSFETNGAYPTGLVVDNAGNAYLAVHGTYWHGSSGTPVEDILLRYDANGNVAWAKHSFVAFSSPVEGLYGFGPMALDGAGNLFVAGSAGGTIVTFNGSGTPILTNQFSPQVIADLDLLCVTPDGHALVAGSRWVNSATLYTTIKFSPGGIPQWTNVLAGPTYNGGNVPLQVVDPAGNSLLIGGAPGTQPGAYHILKINSAGLPLWTNQNVRFGPTNGMVSGAVADAAGNLYLSGYARAANGKYDAVTMKFSGSGNLVWSNRFDGAASNNDLAFALAVNSAGEVYVAGRSENASGKRSFATIKYADRLLYTPPQNLTGVDTLTCSLVDALGHSATGTVDIAIAPGAFGFELDHTVTRMTPGGMVLQLTGAPGTNGLVLEASADTVTWQPIATNVPNQGAVQFLDATAINQPRRFYRVTQSLQP